MQVNDAAVEDAARCRIDTPGLGLIARAHGDGWYLRTTDWFRLPTPRPGKPPPGR